MSDEIKITKVSITKNAKKEEITVSYLKKEPKGEAWFSVENEKHTEPVHDDFRLALDSLKIHFAILCGVAEEKEVKKIETPKPELIQDISINGFTRNGSDQEKITITGTRKVKYGSTTMNSPVQNVLNDSDTAYSFMEDLDSKIDRCCDEAVKYQTGEKRSTATLFSGSENGQEEPAEVSEATA